MAWYCEVPKPINFIQMRSLIVTEKWTPLFCVALYESQEPKQSKRQSDESHRQTATYPWGLRSKESSLLCCRLGEPRSAGAFVAAVAAALVTGAVEPKDPDPLVHTFGGLVNKASDSARCLTWCITPSQQEMKSSRFQSGVRTAYFHYKIAKC